MGVTTVPQTHPALGQCGRTQDQVIGGIAGGDTDEKTGDQVETF